MLNCPSSNFVFFSSLKSHNLSILLIFSFNKQNFIVKFIQKQCIFLIQRHFIELEMTLIKYIVLGIQ